VLVGVALAVGVSVGRNGRRAGSEHASDSVIHPRMRARTSGRKRFTLVIIK
jgi:hypothetical protein